jgi:pilus assembly protein Flp/PilA
MRAAIARFSKSESGTTAIEYALIATGISIAIMVAAQSVGSSLNTLYNTVASDVTIAL